MQIKLYGAILMLGPDGAGLPRLPETLPEARNSLDLSMYGGSHDELVSAAERTVGELRRAGYRVREPSISSRTRPFWMRPTWRCLIQAEI